VRLGSRDMPHLYQISPSSRSTPFDDISCLIQLSVPPNHSSLQVNDSSIIFSSEGAGCATLADLHSSLLLRILFVCLGASVFAGIAFLSVGRPAERSPHVPQHRLKRRYALDGLRTLATIRILDLHLHLFPESPIHQSNLGGECIMTLFFLMSAFIQTEADCLSRPCYAWGDIGLYTARRLARLCPAYFTALLMATMSASSNDIYVLLDAFFLQPWFPMKECRTQQDLAFAPANAGHIWFVSTMMFLTLCHPALYNLQQKTGYRLQMIFLMMLLIAGCTSTSTGLFNYLSHLGIPSGHFPVSRLLTYATGMLLASLCHKSRDVVMNWTWSGACFDLAIIMTISLQYVMVPHILRGYVTALGWCSILVFGSFMADSDCPSIIGGLLASNVFVLPSDYTYGAYMYTRTYEVLSRVFLFAVMKNDVARKIAAGLLPWIAAVASKVLLEGPIASIVERWSKTTAAAKDCSLKT